MSDIAAASAEQATGIEQINKALAQMDEVTQQNSALVEENAATAKTLEHQSEAMDERVGFFRIGTEVGQATRKEAVPASNTVSGTMRHAAGRPVAAPKRPAVGGNGAADRLRTVGATALKGPDWKEF